MTAKQKMIIFVGSEKMVHTPNGKNSPRSFLRKKGKERQKDQSSSIGTAIFVHAREGEKKTSPSSGIRLALSVLRPGKKKNLRNSTNIMHAFIVLNRQPCRVGGWYPQLSRRQATRRDQEKNRCNFSNNAKRDNDKKQKSWEFPGEADKMPAP